MANYAWKRGSTLAALAGLFFIACSQEPDVGQVCTIQWGAGTNNAPDACTSNGDFLETGAVGCDNLVCILTPTSSSTCSSRTAVCSKPCVSDNDCFNSKTGLVCRSVVLDETYINLLRQTNPDLANTYLGDIQFSTYCAYPAKGQ